MIFLNSIFMNCNRWLKPVIGYERRRGPDHWLLLATFRGGLENGNALSFQVLIHHCDCEPTRWSDDLVIVSSTHSTGCIGPNGAKGKCPPHQFSSELRMQITLSDPDCFFFWVLLTFVPENWQHEVPQFQFILHKVPVVWTGEPWTHRGLGLYKILPQIQQVEILKEQKLASENVELNQLMLYRYRTLYNPASIAIGRH